MKTLQDDVQERVLWADSTDDSHDTLPRDDSVTIQEVEREKDRVRGREREKLKTMAANSRCRRFKTIFNREFHGTTQEMIHTRAFKGRFSDDSRGREGERQSQRERERS